MASETANNQTVFLVEDDAAVRKGCEQALSIADIGVRAFADGESMLAALADGRPDLVVSDIRLPGRDGLALLKELRQFDSELPVLLMTGHGDVGTAVQAMRDGAHDFIEKPFPSERLVAAVRSALEKRALVVENRQLRERLQAAGVIALIGQSPAIQAIRQLIGTLAPTGVDILINGETGSGKEVVARAIHEASGRRGPFVAVNCGALPETVFESEIFGHEAGSFTGAGKRRIGRVEHASGGTLFLDEVESMPMNMQIKLLRVLQERVIERLGSNQQIPVNCRVIAASKEDLKAWSEQGKFRADLYYRLNVVRIELPPLRERREDIPALYDAFLLQAAKRFNRPPPLVPPETMHRLMAQEWPGNIRELKNAADCHALGIGGATATVGQGVMPSLTEAVEGYERQLIADEFTRQGGNIQRTADVLKVARTTLHDKLKKYGLL